VVVAAAPAAVAGAEITLATADTARRRYSATGIGRPHRSGPCKTIGAPISELIIAEIGEGARPRSRFARKLRDRRNHEKGAGDTAISGASDLHLRFRQSGK
jgi:hypothetical protein